MYVDSYSMIYFRAITVAVSNRHKRNRLHTGPQRPHASIPVLSIVRRPRHSTLYPGTAKAHTNNLSVHLTRQISREGLVSLASALQLARASPARHEPARLTTLGSYPIK